VKAERRAFENGVRNEHAVLVSATAQAQSELKAAEGRLNRLATVLRLDDLN
jgi:hypothetical protein